MISGLKRGSSCGNGVRSKENPKGRAGVPEHIKSTDERCRVFAAHCMMWSQSCVEVV